MHGIVLTWSADFPIYRIRWIDERQRMREELTRKPIASVENKAKSISYAQIIMKILTSLLLPMTGSTIKSWAQRLLFGLSSTTC